jgi:periplasmic protein TonB
MATSNNKARSPIVQSLTFHFAFVVAALGLVQMSQYLTPQTKTEAIDFVVVNPEVSSAATASTQPTADLTKAKPPPKTVKPREVFGSSKQALTSSNDDSLEVKKGNTVAKEADALKLNASDVDALPIPVDEYLITSTPKLKNEYRIPYPPSARAAGITGSVVMEILITKNGQVAEARLISSPDQTLSDAAMNAIKNFEFEPAKVGADAVAVRIRYAYKFVLQ